MKKNYDHIVIGASLHGILYAVTRAERGESVLLTNVYGFPGGSITEYLNCLQQTDRALLSGKTAELWDAVAQENFSAHIVNPEKVKYSLQQLLERSAVELYFHTTPSAIAPRPDGTIGVTLLAKEGNVTVTGSHVVDASEDYGGAVLAGCTRTVRSRSLHLFITAPRDTSFLAFDRIRTSVQLQDGRYWLTLNVQTADELFAENESHELLDTFRTVLEASGSRIQVLPLGIHTEYTIESSTASGQLVSVLDSMLGERYAGSQCFLKAASAEKLQ
jgi:hypothetical protein